VHKPTLETDPSWPGCVTTPLVREPLAATQATVLAAAFKALSDPVRLRLLSLIASHAGDVCVCDLTPNFSVSEPTISHHLRILREAGLVTSRRQASWVYYAAVPAALAALSMVLETSAPERIDA